MCGRFDCHTPLAWVAEDYFGVTRPIESQAARYNIALGTAISTVRRSGDDSDLNLMRWGFRPSWTGEDAPKPINARSEKVLTSRFFGHAFLHKRCLIPADGWFEWMATEQGKQPYYITDPTLGDREVLFFAGIYSGSIETRFSVAIVTEPAAPNLRRIYVDRHRQRPSPKSRRAVTIKSQLTH